MRSERRDKEDVVGRNESRGLKGCRDADYVITVILCVTLSEGVTLISSC